MSQALYRKWRSQTFHEVVGQQHVMQTLQNALRDGRVAHAYLFAGPRGTGKTSTARILAKALNCAAPEPERPCNRCPTCVAINEGRMIDLIEIDAASNNSVDDIRELREKVGFRPSEGRYKIYIVDEVHMLSTSAFNALLKTLEEPPPHTRFILATTEPHKIPATVLSRCQRFDFRRIPAPEIVAHLRHIAQEEGFQAEEDALLAIARSAQGCMRDAISLLDQMLSFGADGVTLEQVQQVLGTVSAQAVASFVDALAARDVGTGLALIQAVAAEGASPGEFCQQVIEHLRGVLVLQLAQDPALLSDVPGETVAQMQRQAAQLEAATTLFAVKRFSETVRELKGTAQAQLPLEMALIEAVQGPAVLTAALPLPPVAASASSQPAQALPSAPPGETAPAAQPEPLAAVQAADAPLDVAAVQRLRGRWRDFTARVREQCGIQVQAALNSVRDIAVSEHEVAFAFGNNRFSYDMVNKPENLGKVATLLSEFLGQAVKLQCQMGEQARLTRMVGAVAEQPKDGPDPLLEYAMASLGAQVGAVTETKG